MSNEISLKALAEPMEHFGEHLNLENNYQIIFSGKFGTGKTTFLRAFFETKKEDYRVWAISPVNYSIANNDDIVKYIKYDILEQFSTHGIDFEFEVEALKNEILEILTDLGKGVKEITINSLVGLYKKATNIDLSIVPSLITKVWKKLNNPILSKKEKDATEFQESLHNQVSGLYQRDQITTLINSALARDTSQTENILLIDDLDRIDPEHIFRILNVFTAHVNPFSGRSDKVLAFDRIILVCDIQNLRSLFVHKYGFGNSFNGYIDKFYSYHVFHYRYIPIFKKHLEGYWDSLDIRDPSRRKINIFEGRGGELLIKLIRIIVNVQGINFRAIEKLEANNIIVNKNEHCYCSIAIQLMNSLFGHYRLFINFIQESTELFKIKEQAFLNFWCCDFILYINSDMLNYSSSIETQYILQNNDVVTISYKESSRFSGYEFDSIRIKNKGILYNFTNEDFTSLLMKASDYAGHLI